MAEVSVQSSKKQKGGTDKKNSFSSKSRVDLSQSLDSPVKQILYLQRTIGNRAVTHLFQSGMLQAKLKIGKPNDIYEKEADRVSEQVMRRREESLVNSHSSLGKRVTPLIQRQEQPEEEEERNQEEEEQIQTKPIADQITPLIQRQDDEEEEPAQTKLVQRQENEEEEGAVQTKLLQRQEDEEEKAQAKPFLQRESEEKIEGIEKPIQSKGGPGQPPGVTPAIETSINLLKGGGQPLSESTRSFFEPRFGADFGNVRVHTNSRAANMAQAINAKAFTTGKDIVFNSDQYSPGTSKGKRLLAHELTHVVQQRGSEVNPILNTEQIKLNSFFQAFIQRERLREYYNNNPRRNPWSYSDEEIRATNEYRTYMNESYVWQSELRVTDEEALLACRLILREIQERREGQGFNWGREARTFVNTARRQLRISRAVSPLLDRLSQLGSAVRNNSTGEREFSNILSAFRAELEQRINQLSSNEPVPPDLRIIFYALFIWSSDPGNQWGEGVWDSNDLIMTAEEYATVPASQYKCNAYVAEVIYRALGVVHEAYESEEEAGRYFPHRAADWANADVDIEHFNIVEDPQMGDIWSNGTHVGIYLGEYSGRKLYISARDTDSGVFGIEEGIQQTHGIQIKYIEEDGVFRRYTP